jgi:hypothetical protein
MQHERHYARVIKKRAQQVKDDAEKKLIYDTGHGSRWKGMQKTC